MAPAPSTPTTGFRSATNYRPSNGGTLGEEGAHAFGEVARASGFSLQRFLDAELRHEVVHERRVERALCEAQAARRLLRQVGREITGLLHQLGAIDDLPNESPVMRLLGADSIA